MAVKKSNGDGEPITIKKYANRRLYNTATSSYVTLDHLCQMVQEGVDFVVYDAKTGDDITRSVLTQIIVEEEAKGQNLLPIKFLRQIIGLYGDSMQWLVPRYLDDMMDAFAMNQDRMRQSMQDTFGGIFPFGNIEEMGKQNMALFDNAIRMFSPFGQAQNQTQNQAQNRNSNNGATGEANKAAPGRPNQNNHDESLESLKAQVDLLQKQLNELGGKRKDS